MTTPAIRHRVNEALIFEGEVGISIRDMVNRAVEDRVDLSEADLSGANLGDAFLRGATLAFADLSKADLRLATMERASLVGADLTKANLYVANLRYADLRGAELGGADLRGADLRGADLECATMWGADLRGATLSGANLGEKFGRLVGMHPFFQCGPVGQGAENLQAFITDKGIVIKIKNSDFFIDEFAAEVESNCSDPKYKKEYAAAIFMIRAHADAWGDEVAQGNDIYEGFPY